MNDSLARGGRALARLVRERISESAVVLEMQTVRAVALLRPDDPNRRAVRFGMASPCKHDSPAGIGDRAARPVPGERETVDIGAHRRVRGQMRLWALARSTASRRVGASSLR